MRMPVESDPQPANTLPVIGDATVISRSTSVLTAEVEGEVVMMSIEQGCYFGLDDIGSDIWHRIEPPCSFATLIDRLAADYEADRATIAADVQALLGRMAAQDVVRLT
jgi:Coenzyme PQQ synthesis protein D (PqqD)